jgi:phosphate-selective porin
MCSPKPWCVLLILSCVAWGPRSFAQSAPTSGAPAAPAVVAQVAAAEDPDARLAREVAELRAQLQKLQAERQQLDAKSAQAAAPAATPPAAAGVQLAQATPGSSPVPASGNANAPVTRADLDALQKEIDALQAKLAKASAPTAGWNGEHFFLRSSDGQFTLMPTGSLSAQWADYGNNNYGAPPNSFAVRAARFGFQGNYGDQLDYSLTVDTVSSPTVRDAFLIYKMSRELAFTAGQFKVPFSMEVGTGDTNVEFYNRSILTALYPDANGGYRAPGIDAHGRLGDGVFEYQVGLFNGQGILASGTTNEPEIVGRVTFTPFKNSNMDLVKNLAFGGSLEHSRSRGQSGELSFSGALNDGTYTFFPQFPINGNVNRYNFFGSWLMGPLGLRAEYAHLTQDRDDIGALANQGIGFNSQPPIVGYGFYISAVYFLTGEEDPLNAVPRVKHPVVGPASPGESGAPGWGAWAVKFRYSKLTGEEPGTTCNATTTPACPITPVIAPAYYDTTDQFSFGVNWYLNYWVVAKTDINIDRLKDVSVQGVNPHNYFVFLETLQFRF